MSDHTNPLDRFTRSGVRWFRGITASLADQMIDTMLQRCHQQDDPASEDLATADALRCFETGRRHSVRGFAGRWGWNKSTTGRHLRSLGITESAWDERLRDADAGRDAGASRKTGDTHGTTAGHPRDNSGTQQPDCTQESPTRGTPAGHSRDNGGTVAGQTVLDGTDTRIPENTTLPPSRDQVRLRGETTGIPPDYCDYFFDHYASQNWTDANGRSITHKWQLKLTAWWAKEWSNWHEKPDRQPRDPHGSSPSERARRAAERAR